MHNLTVKKGRLFATLARSVRHAILRPPVADGLYDPRFEHDGCGLGFVCRLDPEPCHEVVARGMVVLERMKHRGAEGADPGSVVFDAIEAGAARGAQLILADTAGRLHNKVNLMEELRKVHRIAEKGPATLTETLLVIDATTGNNGLAQAREFADAAGVTGVVLTKLDGTAKGGIALAIQAELGIPIKLVGVGEGADDLIDFDPDEFVEALFSDE